MEDTYVSKSISVLEYMSFMACSTIIAFSSPLHKLKMLGPEPEIPQPKAPAFSTAFLFRDNAV